MTLQEEALQTTYAIFRPFYPLARKLSARQLALGGDKMLQKRRICRNRERRLYGNASAATAQRSYDHRKHPPNAMAERENLFRRGCKNRVPDTAWS